MLSIPSVSPGDMVFWHTDLIHAVESSHLGSSDSSVMYIPAVPLTIRNMEYVQNQRKAFEEGKPPGDFPGGEGERNCVGRAGEEVVKGEDARRAMGMMRFDAESAETPLERRLLEECNARL